jgi:Flp pilus assembly protein TadG
LDKWGIMARKGNFLQRLRRNQSGNVMYITAGLLVPIIATIGAGVDLGQAYMAKSRLQQACDAGVLAGRKSMAEGTFDSEAQTAARNMFNFNYPAGIYDSTNVSFTPTQRGSTEVTGTATARVQTIIMDMFGKENFPLTVNCTAKLEISNTDIMFVLDVTGSMASTNSGDSVNRITALRTETMAFFDTIMAAEVGDAQIRIGVVPYSSNVNVGSILRTANPTWISDLTTIPSRTGAWVQTGSTGPSDAWTNVSGFTTWTNTGTTLSGQTSSSCPLVVPSPQFVLGTITSGPTSTPTVSGTSPRTTTTTTVTTYNATQRRHVWSNSACRLQSAPGVRRLTTTSSITETYNYYHSSRTFNVAALKSGGTISDPLGTNGAAVVTGWNGCIKERDTVAFDDAVASVPSGAFDINIDLVPTNEATRWETHIPAFAFPRTGSAASSQSPSPTTMTTTTDIGSYASSANTGGGWAACPAAAMKLTPMTAASRTSFQTYVNSLQPVGGTYHDVGMTWGARLISPTGLFASENTLAPNGTPINRHIIFMTDGEMAPNPGIYGSQGQEFLMNRVGSNDITELTARHNRRFLEVCAAAKSRNITVWVVSFGTALTTQLRTCASGDNAYQANNSTQLRQQFQSIAQQITRLRLSE